MQSSFSGNLPQYLTNNKLKGIDKVHTVSFKRNTVKISAVLKWVFSKIFSSGATKQKIINDQNYTSIITLLSNPHSPRTLADRWVWKVSYMLKTVRGHPFAGRPHPNSEFERGSVLFQAPPGPS